MAQPIMFAQPLDEPVSAVYMPHPSIQVECTLVGIIGTPESVWASVEANGEQTLVPIHQVFINEEKETQ